MLQKEYMLSHKRACDLRAMAQIPGGVVMNDDDLYWYTIL